MVTHGGPNRHVRRDMAKTRCQQLRAKEGHVRQEEGAGREAEVEGCGRRGRGWQGDG
jgi:hypothetical protein